MFLSIAIVLFSCDAKASTPGGRSPISILGVSPSYFRSAANESTNA